MEALISEKKLIDPISMKTSNMFFFLNSFNKIKVIEFDFLMINILKIFSDQKEEKKRHLHDVFYSADV